MSGAEATRKVVEKFPGRAGEGQPERIAELFAAEVDRFVTENPAVPWLKPRTPRADVAAHFAELAEGVPPDPAGNTVEAVVVDGREAMVTGWPAGTVRATGEAFRVPSAVWPTVEQGQTARYRTYEDSLAAAAACTSGG